MPIEVYNENFPAMGTRFGMVLPGCEHSTGETISQLIKDEISRLENKISRFIPGSGLSIINRFANKYPVKPDEELWNILLECRTYNQLTIGAFDPALRIVSEYLNTLKESGIDGNAETAGKLFSLLEKSGLKNVEFDENEKSVYFKSNDVEIDLGAIGKGLALRNIGPIFKSFDIKNAFISFGESSLLCLGNHPNGANWKVGLPDVFRTNVNCYTFEISDCAVSTSGNTYNNSIYGRVNIITPFTGLPVKEMETILVADKDPVLAEVFSTAFMVLGDDQIKKIISEYPVYKVVKVEYDKENNAVITEY